MIELIIYAIGIFILLFWQFSMPKESKLKTALYALLITGISILFIADITYSLHIKNVYYYILIVVSLIILLIMEYQRLGLSKFFKNLKNKKR